MKTSVGLEWAGAKVEHSRGGIQHGRSKQRWTDITVSSSFYTYEEMSWWILILTSGKNLLFVKLKHKKRF